jgi:hypothetical protein
VEALQTKDGIVFCPHLEVIINSAKSDNVAQVIVPFGTVRRSAGLRPGVKLKNTQHRTSNAEHRSFRLSGFN